MSKLFGWGRKKLEYFCDEWSWLSPIFHITTFVLMLYGVVCILISGPWVIPTIVAIYAIFPIMFMLISVYDENGSKNPLRILKFFLLMAIPVFATFGIAALIHEVFGMLFG